MDKLVYSIEETVDGTLASGNYLQKNGKHEFTFTTDWNMSTQFASKKEAEDFIVKKGLKRVFVTEHMIMDRITTSNRRHHLDLYTPVEKEIYDAFQSVEKMQPDKRLTEASSLMQKALYKVSDFIDEKLKTIE